MKTVCNRITVTQVTGYYQLHLDTTVKSAFYLSDVQEQNNRYKANLLNELMENFDISHSTVYTNRILIKCARRELRKIETYLTLQGIHVTCLKRWKNERSWDE